MVGPQSQRIHMNFPVAALDAMTELMTGLNQDPASKKAYEIAAAELADFLQRHQYYGEAAVMVAALTLAKDEADE